MEGSALAARTPRDRAVSLARALPWWAWLTGIVAVSIVVRWAIGRRSVAPWIMVDELIYSELAKSFAAGGRFLVRDHPTAAYGVVYPMLISPAWAAFKSVPDAYAAAKAINAVAMSLTAVPAYFLARRVVGQGLAVAAAALTVAVPSMLYTGTLMTENAFYPVFVLAALAIVAWLERPTWLRTLAMLAVAALAYLTRAQALALLPAIVTAPALLAWAQRRGRRGLRDYWRLYALVAAGIVLALAVQLARGRSLLGLLGAYRVAGSSSYTAWGVFHWLAYHVAELDLSLGVLPFAALVLLAVVARGLDRRLQVFLAAAVATSFWLVLEVAAFASEQSLRVEERNMFYVAPLFLIALLAWIERGCPRPARAAAAVALVAGALPGLLPWPTLITLNAVSDTAGILPLWWLKNAVSIRTDELGIVVVLVCVAVAALFLFVPLRYALALPALLFVYFAVVQKPIDTKFQQASVGALFGGITADRRDWIDRAVGPDAQVAEVWSGALDKHVLWENEFFNRSVGTIYDLVPEPGGGLASTKVTLDPRTGLLLAAGKPVRPRYVVADWTVGLDGDTVAQDARKGVTLYRLHGPLRQAVRVAGLYRDTWSGRHVVYTRGHCAGGTLTVTVHSDPSLFFDPQTIVARSGTRTVTTRLSPVGFAKIAVPLRSGGAVCRVEFTISPTAVPKVVTHGTSSDTRALGVHFDEFAYTP